MLTWGRSCVFLIVFYHHWQQKPHWINTHCKSIPAHIVSPDILVAPRADSGFGCSVRLATVNHTGSNNARATDLVYPWYASRRTTAFPAIFFFHVCLVLFRRGHETIWRFYLMAEGNCSQVKVLLPGATFFTDIFGEVAVFINQDLGLSSTVSVEIWNGNRGRTTWLRILMLIRE